MNRLIFASVLFFLILSSLNSKAQYSTRMFLNAAYVTNFAKCSDCVTADRGGAIRAGLLTKGRFGFYAGYLIFKENHSYFDGFDDKGSGILAGTDIMFLSKPRMQCYTSLGIFIKRYQSHLADPDEIETSVLPDFGILFNFNSINAFIGWQPSEPHHINLGVGFTFDNLLK